MCVCVNRPAYQGANPISDLWCEHALPMLNEHFISAVYEKDNFNARMNMQYAACYAGMGFGTAGVHLCHGMSYPISGLNKNISKYTYWDYDTKCHITDYPIIPHGVSVVITAPTVFDFTCQTKLDRHRKGAIMLGADENKIKFNDCDSIAGHLKERLLFFMDKLNIPLGLSKIGYQFKDINALVDGTIPQERVTKLSPNPIDKDILGMLFEKSMAY